MMMVFVLLPMVIGLFLRPGRGGGGFGGGGVGGGFGVLCGGVYVGGKGKGGCVGGKGGMCECWR